MSPEKIQRRLQEAFQHFSAGDVAAAEKNLRTVLAAAPRDANALNLLAGVLRAKGDMNGALAAFDRAIAQAPGAAALLTNRGNLLLELHRHEEAVRSYDAALALRADHADTYVNRGRSLAALTRHTEAIADFDRAHRLGHRAASLHYLWALSLAALERREEALQRLEAAIDPNDADAWDNRGALLHELDQLEAALASNDRAIAIRPDHTQAWMNRALTLFALKRTDEARTAFEHAAMLSPDDAVLHYERGASALTLHNLRAGWSGFEQRWAVGVRAAGSASDQPAWRGEKLDGPLRIWPEQGIGDEILFARLALLARERSEAVILECEPRLVSLFARSFPSLAVRSVLQATAPAAAQAAIGSLGHAMNVGVDELGDGRAYLSPDAAKRGVLREKYQTLARGRPIIGIAWSSTTPKIGSAKSTPLEAWGALLQRDALFVNLQYGDVAAEIAAARARFGCEIIEDVEVDQRTDLDAFAAQVAAMDQIVSVSNTTVHFAGALGIPCLVLVAPARGRLWYWGLEGERTPWYASLRLVRRDLSESREEQIARAAALLS